MPGWGESDPVTWQERDHSTALVDLMDAMGIERATIIGKSMGGGTTLRLRELVDVMTFDSAFATDELIQARADMVLAHPEHAQNFIDGTGKRAVVELDHARLREIDVPVLLFHGRDDRVVSYEHSLRLVSAINNARLLLINQCGHWAQIEHAVEFNRVVRDFIQNN